MLTDVTAVDLNQDGKLDLVTVNGGTGTGLSVPSGKGDGTFQSPQMFGSVSGYTALAIGDLNRDGISDVSTIGGPNFSVFLND